MLTILLFIVTLSILVVGHEFGHYITAKKCGMRVFEFGIGFPPRVFGVYRDPLSKKIVWVFGKGKSSLSGTVGGDERVEEFPATVYSLNWLPIGGFCKIKGESGEDAGSKDSFAHKKPWMRVLVLVAGVVMNFLLAGMLLSIGFGTGIPTDAGDGIPPRAIPVEPRHVVAEVVEKNSPAEKAGIRFGDTIVAVNGIAVDTAKDMIAFVDRNADRDIALLIKRGREEKIVHATPAVLPNIPEKTPKLGIALVDAAVIRYPWSIAIPKGFVAAGVGFANIFVSFYILIKTLLVGRGLAFDVSGPVGIATVVGASARLGMSYLLNVSAMISLSLAAVNILPIPALDGGRVLFVLIELVTRKKVPMKYEQLAHTIGFMLLMVLIIIVTGRDIAGLMR